jgi:hypothetical protein
VRQRAYIKKDGGLNHYILVWANGMEPHVWVFRRTKVLMNAAHGLTVCGLDAKFNPVSQNKLTDDHVTCLECADAP